MPFIILRQNITKMHTDAIVNAANTRLEMGGGVCEAIFCAAGIDLLKAACFKLSPIKTGKAVITPGFNLKSKYIIHGAGPAYFPEKADECKALLKSTYMSCLALAKEYNCESIAFPLISSGIYRYPKAEALQIATEAIKEFLLENDMSVYLCVFDKASFKVSKILTGEVKAYIDDNYTPVNHHAERKLLSVEKDSLNEFDYFIEDLYNSPKQYTNEELTFSKAFNEKLEASFSETLLSLIDEKGKTDPEVYKRANIDRKLFSKIRTQKDYLPSKKTALSFAVALELGLEETEKLLKSAGYTLSHSRMSDVIIEFFITNKQYDIFKINEVLFEFDQPLLGS